MKYVLLICGTQADQDAFEALSPDALRARYADVGRWFHAIRAQLLVDVGRHEQARAAGLRALAMTNNQAEQSLLRRRLGQL